ncbi:putative aarF domain-containing protein kinase [Senna tora]|uniref:Putative aarF domain-containing protein kinase n=1 Tax=Senna tora TaxID=362788 RepID=A0A834SSF2_9FABA|nr:putative aarF domain-containing protein kinase [Senna tora]
MIRRRRESATTSDADSLLLSATIAAPKIDAIFSTSQRSSDHPKYAEIVVVRHGETEYKLVPLSHYGSTFLADLQHNSATTETVLHKCLLLAHPKHMEVITRPDVGWLPSCLLHQNFYSTSFSSVHGEKPSAEYAKLRKESLESQFGLALGTYSSKSFSSIYRFGPFLALYRAAIISFHVFKLTFWQLFVQDIQKRAIKRIPDEIYFEKFQVSFCILSAVTTAENGPRALELLGLAADEQILLSESSIMKEVPVVIMSSENVPTRINKYNSSPKFINHQDIAVHVVGFAPGPVPPAAGSNGGA